MFSSYLNPVTVEEIHPAHLKVFLCKSLQNLLSKSLNSAQLLLSSGIGVWISALSWLVLSSSYHLICKANRSILTRILNNFSCNDFFFPLIVERAVTHPAHLPSSASLLFMDARGAQRAHKIPKMLQNWKNRVCPLQSAKLKHDLKRDQMRTFSSSSPLTSGETLSNEMCIHACERIQGSKDQKCNTLSAVL